MRKYEYNYKPSHEEINNAWELLSLAGKVELTFDILKDTEDEQLEQIASLIRSMDSFNKKDNATIAGQFKDFFKSLPRANYGENNPNNGNALFDKIILRGDDTIILKTRGFQKYFEQYDWIDLTKWIKKVGEEFWSADECSLNNNKLIGGLEEYEEYIIRFWWD
jgi:hypothetical protein